MDHVYPSGAGERGSTCSDGSIILPRATSAAAERRQISGDFDLNQSGNLEIYRMSQLEETLMIV